MSATGGRKWNFRPTTDTSCCNERPVVASGEVDDDRSQTTLIRTGPTPCAPAGLRPPTGPKGQTPPAGVGDDVVAERVPSDPSGGRTRPPAVWAGGHRRRRDERGYEAGVALPPVIRARNEVHSGQPNTSPSLLPKTRAKSGVTNAPQFRQFGTGITSVKRVVLGSWI